MVYDSVHTSTVSSGSDMSASSKTPIMSGSYSGRKDLGHIQELITDALQIPASLLEQSRTDLHMAYAKYLAIQNTTKELHKMISTGIWTQKMPTNDEIVQIFMSKTAYYRNHHKIFPKVSKGSALKKWLANTDDAPDDSEVWGTYKPTFDNLQNILSA
jgi:hypothetical protein